jgi:phosphoribosylaminoimidazole-succinocarboxamide synthase
MRPAAERCPAGDPELPAGGDPVYNGTSCAILDPETRNHLRMPYSPFLQSQVPGYPCRRGKVRDVYDLGDRLVIIATDRISAFDWVLPTGIPDKGRVLTNLTKFWLDYLGVPNHLLSMDVSEMGPAFAAQAGVLAGRTMLVHKARVVPVECVVRGYLAGSGWKEYRRDRTVCGIALPAGLQESQPLPEAIFTPATKEETGHDINIAFAQMVALTGQEVADELRQRSLDVYRRAADFARTRGIIIADTKFEWGRLPDGTIILIDEVLTPDSSRFWPLDQYRPGISPPSFDKQFVRDWLETTGWDKNSPPPKLPADVVARTREKYLEAFERLTGHRLDV